MDRGGDVIDGLSGSIFFLLRLQRTSRRRRDTPRCFYASCWRIRLNYASIYASASSLLRRTAVAQNSISTFSATVVKILYGIDVADTNDKYISLIEKVLSVVVAFTPGRYLVDVLPVLQYVPEWMPGAGFQKEFREWRSAAREVKTTLFREATERVRVFSILGCWHLC